MIDTNEYQCICKRCLAANADYGGAAGGGKPHAITANLLAEAGGANWTYTPAIDTAGLPRGIGDWIPKVIDEGRSKDLEIARLQLDNAHLRDQLEKERAEPMWDPDLFDQVRKITGLPEGLLGEEYVQGLVEAADTAITIADDVCRERDMQRGLAEARLRRLRSVRLQNERLTNEINAMRREMNIPPIVDTPPAREPEEPWDPYDTGDTL